MPRGTEEISVVIHFRDIPTDEDVREHLTARCLQLAAEFPETLRYDVTLSQGVGSISAQARATGKKTDSSAHADGGENARHAGDLVLETLERELRRDHDKRIFSPRRKAQKDVGRRLD